MCSFHEFQRVQEFDNQLLYKRNTEIISILASFGKLHKVNGG